MARNRLVSVSLSKYNYYGTVTFCRVTPEGRYVYRNYRRDPDRLLDLTQAINRMLCEYRANAYLYSYGWLVRLYSG